MNAAIAEVTAAAPIPSHVVLSSDLLSEFELIVALSSANLVKTYKRLSVRSDNAEVTDTTFDRWVNFLRGQASEGESRPR